MQEAQEMWAQFPGQEETLEKVSATHSSILAWKIPWIGEPAGYSPWGCKESGWTEPTTGNLSKRYNQKCNFSG